MTTPDELAVIAEIHREGMARCFDAYFLQQCGIEAWDAEGFIDATE